jgi:RNA polymerase sigma factor (TIGR02999 family)
MRVSTEQSAIKSANIPHKVALAETDSSAGITQWLVRWREGDDIALDRVTGLVYAELRRLAGSMVYGERADHTLQPTALVHELYTHLAGARGIDWQCRGQFFGIASRLMRRILVDYARKRGALKRGRGRLAPLTEEAFKIPGPDVLDINIALGRFEQEYPRQARVVEMRFFGGLTSEETVEAMRAAGEDVSLRTVERDWRFSRAWLQNELGKSSH